MPVAKTIDEGRKRVKELVARFRAVADDYTRAGSTYNETALRTEFLNPLLEALGWDVINEGGQSQDAREVIYEANLADKEEKLSRRPDYEMRLARQRKFYAEAKLASIDVGVVTGLNEYFVLSEEAKKSAHLNGYTRPIVARSGHMRGINFSDDDWKRLTREARPSYLLDVPPKPPAELPSTLQEYIRHGEEMEFHKGYKCRIRKLWYIVPSVYNPDGFMLRQIHRYPKIVVNQAGATSTDTIHRVRLLDGTDGKQLAAAALNSITFGFAEIVGRSYGGGVLELEPREAEHLLVPYQGADRLDFEKFHNLMLKDDVEAVLDTTDRVLLQDWLGLTEQETRTMRGIWVKLRDRRLNRKYKKVVAAV